MATFKLFAGTETGLRSNNEDNFTVCPDLTKGEWVIPSDQQTVIPLGQSGCLMVVADGMGGQNAGEVASAIAISTVQELFTSDNLTQSLVSKAESARDFMKKVIVKADRRIKEYSSEHSEAEGMGSTIVMVWLLGNNAHVAWMGDSRAYSYLPNEGLRRLSKDHSYVQKLVDAGQLTEQQAMEHPDSNIITRSLGDTSQRAKPDAVTHVVQTGEVILLCSDGLCGFCTDEQIGGIIAQNQQDLPTCKEVLTEAALERDGSDNITIALLQVVQTGSTVKNTRIDKVGRGLITNILLAFFAAFILLSLGFAVYKIVIVPKPDQQHVVVPPAAPKENRESEKDNGVQKSLIKESKKIKPLKGSVKTDTTSRTTERVENVSDDSEKDDESLEPERTDDNNTSATPTPNQN